MKRQAHPLLLATFALSLPAAAAAPGAAVAHAFLQRAEPSLTDESGLPGRPWYKHLLYAPGRFTGYGVKTVPGVREGIEQGDFQEAERYVALTAQALDRYSQQLEAATALLSGGSPQ